MISVRFHKGYYWATFFLLVILLLFPIVGAADITQVHSDYEIWRGEISNRVYDLAISEDGKYIAAGSRDGTVSLIDQSGKLLWAYNNMKVNGLLANPEYGGDEWVSVSISSDGEYIAAGIWDNSESRARSPKILFFDRTGNLLWISPAQYVSDVAMTSDGSKVAVAADRGVILFDKDGSVVWEYDHLGSGDSISVSDDGAVVAWTGDYNAVCLFDTTGSLVWEKTLGIGRGWGMDNQYGRVSSDGSVLLVVQAGPDDGVAGLFGKEGNLLWSRTEPNSSWNSGDISSNGEYSVIGMRNEIILIDRQGNTIWTQNYSAISSRDNNYYLVDISRDGAFIAAASAAYGENLRILTKGGDPLWTAKVNSGIERLAMSADGEYIATASGSTLYLYKKERGTNAPPYIADLKSNVRYDTKSFGEYLYSKYLTPANLVIGAIIIGIFGVIGYCLWRLRKYLAEHHTVDRISRWIKYLIISVAVFFIASFLNFFFAGLHSSPIAITGSPLNNILLMITAVLGLGAIVMIIISIVGAVVGYIRK